MKYFKIFIVSIFLIACNNDKKTINRYNPSENIKQIIQNEKAQKLFDEGYNYSQQGKYELAKSKLYESLEIENSPITLNELGVIEFVNENYKKALEYYSKGRDVNNLYWPIYINEARTYEKISDFNNAEKILLKLKKLCNSEYWIAYSDFYLSLIYANSHQDCDKVYKYLEKSKMLANDPVLKIDYNKFKKFIKENCG